MAKPKIYGIQKPTPTKKKGKKMAREGVIVLAIMMWMFILTRPGRY
jgi:hypothetical protein